MVLEAQSDRLILLTQAGSSELVARVGQVAAGFEIVADATPDDGTLARAEVIAGHLEPTAIAKATAARWIHVWTAGADADLSDEMVASSALLTTSAGNGAMPLAEHAMMLMIMLTRDATRWVRAQAEERWERYTHPELAGSTVAIVGMGGAGRDLATKCAAFHMNVLGVRNRPDLAVPDVNLMYGPSDLILAAEQADFLVVAAPLTASTRTLVSREVIEALKPTAYVINISRGEVVDNGALLEAVQNRRIAGAGLDAHEEEPLPASSAWWHAPNTIITPHNAATTPATMARAFDIFVDNMRRYVAGETLMNVVDKSSGYAPR